MGHLLNPIGPIKHLIDFPKAHTNWPPKKYKLEHFCTKNAWPGAQGTGVYVYVTVTVYVYVFIYVYTHMRAGIYLVTNSHP